MRRGFLVSSKKEPADSRTIHKSTREVDTLQAAITSKEKQASIDINTSSSIDTNTMTPIDTNTSSSIDATCRKEEKVEVLILTSDENGILRDKEGRRRSNAGQLINAQGAVIPDVIDVAEMNEFCLSREWYDWAARNSFQNLPHQHPHNHIQKLQNLVTSNRKHVELEDVMLCKIYPYSLSGNAFMWLSQLQSGSLTSWEDTRRAFLYEFLNEYEAGREKEFNDDWDRCYPRCEQKKKELNTNAKKEDIQVQKTVEVTQKGDERHGSEQSKEEEADTSDPTLTSINPTTSSSTDTSTKTSIDISSSTSIDTTFRETERDAFELKPIYIALMVFEEHYFCKIFPYSLAREAACWFNKLPPGSITTWNDIVNTFLENFLYDAAANLEIEMEFMQRNMVDDDEQHEEADDSDLTLASIDPMTSESIDITTSESIEGGPCCQTKPPKSIDVSSYYLAQDVERKITMKDFLELEKFLELEDGKPLEYLDDGKEITMEYFLELEDFLEHLDGEQPEDLGQNSEQKTDDDQHTSRRDLETSPKASIDRHPHDIIDRYYTYDIDRHLSLDEPGYIVELEQVEEGRYTPEASHLDIHEHQRPPICTEEADGFHKRVNMTHDPVNFVVPCAVFKVESPIPPDKSTHMDPYIEVSDDQKYAVASQRGLRYGSDINRGASVATSIDTDQIKSIDTDQIPSIDTDQIPSIDTPRGSEQNEFEVCRNLFDGGTRLDKSGGKKRRNWKKRKRFKFDHKLSLIPHFSDGFRKYRVRSKCFS